MKFLIDTFSPEKAAKILEYYPAEGVTTNPAIICRENAPVKSTLLEMRRAVGGKMLHVQTLKTTAEDMVREALALRDFLSRTEGDFFVKLPALPEGLKACRMLKKQGVGVTMTAVFSAAQALLCARAGADFVAPFVNKLDDAADGEECVRSIVRIFREFGLSAKVLSASFRNVAQVTRVALSGSDYITLPPEFFDRILNQTLTLNAIEGFEEGWREKFADMSPEDMIR